MSGPKHLWSGDWERESADAADRLADQTPPAGDRVANQTPREVPTRPKPQRPLGRTVAVVAVALLVVAAAAFGLTAVLGSSGSPTSTTAAVASPGSAKPVSWLGMEIQTLPPGAAVVESVGLGSAGYQAGLQPGDVIVEVNHRAINGAEAIGPAIRGLHAGDQVQMQVSHGSGLYLMQATLAAPPAVQP